MSKSSSKVTWLDAVWRLGALLALVAITVLVSKFMFGQIGGFSGVYQAVVVTLLLISYVLILSSFLTFVAGKTKGNILGRNVKIVTAAILMVVAILSYGVLQDLAGVHCYGFFGSDSSCIDSISLSVFIVMLSPFVFIPASLGISGLLAWSLVDEYRQSR